MEQKFGTRLVLFFSHDIEDSALLDKSLLLMKALKCITLGNR